MKDVLMVVACLIFMMLPTVFAANKCLEGDFVGARKEIARSYRSKLFKDAIEKGENILKECPTFSLEKRAGILNDLALIDYSNENSAQCLERLKKIDLSKIAAKDLSHIQKATETNQKLCSKVISSARPTTFVEWCQADQGGELSPARSRAVRALMQFPFSWINKKAPTDCKLAHKAIQDSLSKNSKMEFNSCMIYFDNWEPFASLSGIKTIELDSRASSGTGSYADLCPMFSFKDWSPLSQIKGLEILKLINIVASEKSIDFDLLAKIPTLRVLMIRNMANLPKNLKALNVTKLFIEELSADDLTIIKLPTKLEILGLNNVKMTDWTFLKTAPRLKKIILYGPLSAWKENVMPWKGKALLDFSVFAGFPELKEIEIIYQKDESVAANAKLDLESAKKSIPNVQIKTTTVNDSTLEIGDSDHDQ